MGANFEVRVLVRDIPIDQSETQLRKGDRPWEGSVERSRGLTYRNQIGGAVDQGEWASDHEALGDKGQRRKSGSRAVKVGVLIRGGLVLRLKGRRVHETRSEKSAAVIVGARAPKGQTEERAGRLVDS